MQPIKKHGLFECNPQECRFCTKEGPLYDFKHFGCLARFLIQQPTLTTRRAWLERWTKEHGAEAVEEIKQHAIKLWRNREIPSRI